MPYLDDEVVRVRPFMDATGERLISGLHTDCTAIKSSLDTLRAVLLDLEEQDLLTDATGALIKSALDNIKTSTDSIKASTDTVKTSLDAIKNSIDAITFPEYTNISNALGLIKDAIEGIEQGQQYVHPSYTPAVSGLYKVTVDNLGHVSHVEPVVKQDIVDLGIPESDTTYEEATQQEDGLMSKEDKAKLDDLSSFGFSVVGGKLCQTFMEDENE